MADTQIFRGAVGDAPVSYVLPESVEFILKAVNADYDGSGSAAAWLPCVEIISDSGHVIARAVDPGVSVAAGGSAEVSFFPGVKHAAAASSAGGEFPFLILTGATTSVPSPPVGDSDHGKFNTPPVWTNKLSEWTFTLDGAGFIKQVNVAGPGLYYVACQGEFAASGATFRKSLAVNTSGNVNQTYNSPNFFGTSPFWQTEGAVRESAMVEAWCPLNSSGGFFSVEPSTNVGAGVNFTPDYLFIVKFPLNPT